MENQKKKKVKKSNSPIRVGISVGDINGIGIEIIIKALRNHEILNNCTPVIYGTTKLLAFYKKAIDDDLLVYRGVNDASEIQHNKVNVVQCWAENVEIEPGEKTKTGGKYAFISLEKATQDLASGKIDVLVTAPISKETIHQAGFEFPGHTEYLAHLSKKKEALMIMVANNLRVALVTGHIPLKQVVSEINEERILSKLLEFEKSLRNDFGIIRPKIAVLGVNPHAGENGDIGKEEKEIISPAIEKAQAKKILAFGPYSADGFFGSHQFNQFDGVLSMYHDQGLTAFKSIAFNEGVNYTSGLPIVRTSPDHGTAFSIAGKGVADEQSMRSAIYLAIDIYNSRKLSKAINGDNKIVEKQEIKN